ncbi:bifunctional diguanylate cyclase/phosphodiesterase [Actinotalea sp. K2]|uniref:putative bifunctional diguanylate cyclase/phosphodiesterase n=1 Tax=Actinotalea sp. K2 TaxID=2939438 RepID=UPI00201806A8|nr:EAL domain-containing protein [Actinotalea sp. K2]MCL3860520.1 EAL domain-containing protein [Actinotalea sp. K2]
MQDTFASARAHHDALTGLTSRHALTELLAAELEAHPDRTVGAVVVDVDRFALINDTLGHTVGDLVLSTLGSRLAELTGGACVAGRIGGDEFLLALFGTTREEVELLAAAVTATMAEPISAPGRDVVVTVSLGLALTEPASAVDTLMRHAGLALHHAKLAGRNRTMWFAEELDADLETRMGQASLEGDLRSALDSAQLQLHYQTAFDLGTGAVIGVEALLRWHHPQRGVIPPLEVITMAEETGLIEPLGSWVIRTAMDQAALWAPIPGFTVWVNVSPRQLSQAGLATFLQSELVRVGLAPHRFGIEVTESALAAQNEAAAELRRIEDLGVQIAIDDFGTGYSSLARLVRFPVDVIKIDRSFVNELGSTTGDAVVNGIVTLAKGLGAEVIAEGVETQQQLARLQSTGCDAAAGFLLARPVAVRDVALDASAWSSRGIPEQCGALEDAAIA